MKRIGKVIFTKYKKPDKEGHIRVYLKGTIYISKMFCDILQIKHGESYSLNLDLDKIKERKLEITFGNQK